MKIAKSLVGAPQAKPGDAVNYQIVVSNTAQGPITQPIAVIDNLPAGLEGGSWTCAGACGSQTSGTVIPSYGRL